MEQKMKMWQHFKHFKGATILMTTDHTYMVQVQEIKGLRADGDNMQFWTELFQYLLNKTSVVSMETFWTGLLYCFVLYH